MELPAADGSGSTTVQQMNYEQLEKLYNDLRTRRPNSSAAKLSYSKNLPRKTRSGTII